VGAPKSPLFFRSGAKCGGQQATRISASRTGKCQTAQSFRVPGPRGNHQQARQAFERLRLIVPFFGCQPALAENPSEDLPSSGVDKADGGTRLSAAAQPGSVVLVLSICVNSNWLIFLF